MAVIVFIGAPGAGKSTVGAKVAHRLGLAFTDSDQLIEHETGMSISDIFVTQGEPHFRELEERVIAQQLGTAQGVLALGGGAVMSHSTREALRGHDVVWLHAGLSQTVDRIGMNRNRPLLLGNIRGQLAELMSAREPFYREVATITIDTSDLDVDGVVDAVCKALSGTQEHS